VGFVVDIVGTGAGFLRALRFPLPIIPPTGEPAVSFVLVEDTGALQGVCGEDDTFSSI
jgi:hypothetical protein